MIQEPEFVEKTRQWCNSIRAQQGKEPIDRLPKGERMEPTTCPCGAATGMIVTTASYWETVRDAPRNPKIYDLPLEVRMFVAAFDRGDLPQYEKD